MIPDTDYLIIGSGAGGAATAYQLVQNGRRVVLLEKGGELPDDGSTLDSRVVVGGRFNSQQVWDRAQGGTFVPQEHFNVGGKTRWYGAALLRLDPAEFQADPALGLRAWPFDASELAPYYQQAEALLDVRHFPDEAGLQRIAAHLKSAGWRASSMPLGLVGDIARHPYEQTHFDGYAVPFGLKADARYRLLQRIRMHENFTLQTEAEVSELLPDRSDPRRIRGVRCVDGREFHATHTLLATGAMHSPQLLQRYFEQLEDSHRPAGARWVGRYYKFHILTAVIGFGAHVFDDRTGKTSLFVHERFPHSSVQPLGGWAGPEEVRIKLPQWLPNRIKYAIARRAYGLFLQTEDASHADNRVIGPGVDRPRPMLDYDQARMPTLVREHRAMVRNICARLRRAGLLPLSQAVGVEGSAHCGGSLIAGDDPDQSVVDAAGKVHGLHNLYVVDGSVLPRLGRENPALTIYALGLRAADLMCRTSSAGVSTRDAIADLAHPARF